MLKRSFKIGKLIRDKIPAIMSEHEVIINNYILSETDYIKQLKLKLLEEAKEIIQAKNIEELSEELADVSEVILSLSKAAGISSAEIEKMRRKKKKEKGGFEAKIYGDFAEIYSDNQQALDYCLNQPKKYPEIFKKAFPKKGNFSPKIT